MGPLLFNIYLNDLFYFILDTDVCNFADDTTLYATDMELPTLMDRLQNEIKTCVNWFYLNYMKLNGDKCNLMIGGNKNGIIVTETFLLKVHKKDYCGSKLSEILNFIFI